MISGVTSRCVELSDCPKHRQSADTMWASCWCYRNQWSEGEVPVKTVYITIGNSDDKLSQVDWVKFVNAVRALLNNLVRLLYREFFTDSISERQSACWNFDVRKEMTDRVREGLTKLTRQFQQDSIAWAEVVEVELLRPTEESR